MGIGKTWSVQDESRAPVGICRRILRRIKIAFYSNIVTSIFFFSLASLVVVLSLLVSSQDSHTPLKISPSFADSFVINMSVSELIAVVSPVAFEVLEHYPFLDPLVVDTNFSIAASFS